MLKSPSSAPSANPEQLLLALVASLKLLLVSLSLVTVVVVLFVKAFVGFAMVVLQAVNLLLGYLVALVASVEEVKSFARFLVVTAG